MTPDTPIPGHPRLSWWRRWSGFMALAALVLVSGIGWATIESEGRKREEQFCGLVLSQHTDRVTRLHNTESFLETPAGMEPTALNQYIEKVSLPQTRAEVAKEKSNIPSLCWKYD